jgi:hypothetical protein
MAGLVNAASALRALNGMRSEIGVINDTYDLLEYDDVEGNIKRIGDRIIDKIREDYIDGNPNNTPEKIKAQIKLDVLTIYYENSGERKVKNNIKEKVCQAWYGALKTRIEKIMKDIVFLLNKEDVANPTTTGGGFSLGKMGSLGNLMGKKAKPGTAEDGPLVGAADALTNVSSNGMPMDPTQISDALSGAEQQPELSEDEKEKNKQEKLNEKNNLFFEKLIEYKSKLFEIENFEKRPLQRSATVSQVYELHESIISKILCNYAVINRDILVGELRKIILGNNAIKELEGDDSNTTNPDEKDSVYQSFLKKIRGLGNEENRDKSKPISLQVPVTDSGPEPVQDGNSIYKFATSMLSRNSKLSPNATQQPNPDANDAVAVAAAIASTVANENNNNQTGGRVSKQIPEYIPSTYIWENIKGYVEERLQILIQEKMSLNKENTESIKKGFQEVFLQANCDSLDLVSIENEEMTVMLNQEYHRMLDYLCKSIPDKYAAPILQSYILRNFDAFTNYLATIFKQDVSFIESFFLGYRNVPSKMFEDTDVKPVYPEIKREDVPADADYDALDDCCNKRDGDKDLDATGVSGFIKTENIGKEPSIKDRFTPSILLPAFNVFKKEFTECSENTDFLAVLFNMYSGKSIKFMQQIQQQFSHDGVNDFIERYILTKHPYTTKIIAECIKHASDIKITLAKNSKNVPKPVDEDEAESEEFETKKTEFNDNIIKLVSQYAAFLMHSAADISLKIDTTAQNAYIVHVDTQIEAFSGLCTQYSPETEIVKIKEGIMNEIPEQEKGSYNNALRTIFNANKSTSNSVKRITKKVRVDLGAKKRYISSLFSKKPESKEKGEPKETEESKEPANTTDNAGINEPEEKSNNDSTSASQSSDNVKENVDDTSGQGDGEEQSVTNEDEQQQQSKENPK